MSADCIFCKIVAREIPGEIVHETDDVLAFRDVNPQAPTHILVVPKEHVAKLSELEDGQVVVAGKLVLAARAVAQREGLQDWRLVVNNGAGAGQSVFHIHFHVLGGRGMTWPPG